MGNKCDFCHAKFNFYLPKHSCKRCFKYCCYYCSKGRGEVRKCNKCFEQERSIKQQRPEEIKQEVQKVNQNANNQTEADNSNFEEFDLANLESANQLLKEGQKLPENLINILEASGVSRAESQQNPAEALEAILFQMQQLPPQKLINQSMDQILSFKQENPEDTYFIKQIIGKGWQGTVYAAQCKATGEK